MCESSTECAWLLECNVSFGELSRSWTQFTGQVAPAGVHLGRACSSYRRAASGRDILHCTDADEVPVGDDQRQHIELTRDIADRFNSRYGPTFKPPEAVVPAAGARVTGRSSTPPTRCPSRWTRPGGTVDLLDDPSVIVRKIKSAVTDSESEVRYDAKAKPGVSNLLSILGAATGRTPEEAAAGYSMYGPLKSDTADAVVELLRPIRTRFAELEADPAETSRLLAIGADKARAIASVTLDAGPHQHRPARSHLTTRGSTLKGCLSGPTSTTTSARVGGSASGRDREQRDPDGDGGQDDGGHGDVQVPGLTLDQFGVALGVGDLDIGEGVGELDPCVGEFTRNACEGVGELDPHLGEFTRNACEGVGELDPHLGEGGGERGREDLEVVLGGDVVPAARRQAAP